MKKTIPVFLRAAVLRLLPVAALLLAGSSLQANPALTTLGGGNPNVNPKYLGYRDGYTLTNALFHTPSGLALDPTGQFLFVADRDNNAIRYLDLNLKYTWTVPLNNTNLLQKPIGVYFDNNYFLYVLNRGNGTNGTVITFDLDLTSPTYGDAVLTNAVKLANATGMAFDAFENIYVAVQSNTVIKIPAGATTNVTVATVAIAGTSLQGITVKQNGLIAACDAGRNGIYLINPLTGTVTTNAGFHGVGDFQLNNNNVSAANSARFNQPMCVLETGDGTLIVSDYGNNRVKAVLISGVVTNLFGVNSNFWTGTFPGWLDGTVQVPDSVTPNAQSRLPYGLAFGPDGTIYVSEDFYHTIRKATGAGLDLLPPAPPGAPQTLTATTNAFEQVVLNWSAVSGGTNYLVERSPSSGGPYTVLAATGSTTYTDTNVVAGSTYYYVVAAVNSGGAGSFSPQASITLPFLPVTTPQIGYITFPPPNGTSVFNPVSSSVTFNNDTSIVIEGMAGSTTFFTYANTAVVTNVPDPTASSPSAPIGYADGLTNIAAVAPYTVSSPLPYLTLPYLSIKAIGEQLNHPNSAIASAQFLFVCGNPEIIGNNAANFQVSDITANATLYYTVDGSTPSPTNPAAGSLPPSALSNSVWNVSFSLVTNTLFQVVAYRSNYQPSAVVSNVFTTSAFQPTTISFGFASGQASSAFIASPGQTFYAPVTLTLAGTPAIYSLQFNLVVTNGFTNSGPAVTGNFSFQSMLDQPIPNTTPQLFTNIPPAMFAGGGLFTNGIFENSTENLLGVGWLERGGETNLYNSGAQTLITYSQAHDTQFNSSGGQVIVGGFNFVVPSGATNGQTYQIQIGRPTATSDGIGGPGSDVYISAPTNNGISAGTINALKQVTIGQFKYLVGSVYPFGWFNAGDFGSSNIVNADVEQVFEAAIYSLNSPPPGSDFFDAMDSCGNLGTNNGAGLFIQSTFYNQTNSFFTNNPNTTLFNGNDGTINQIVFGDGVLDICDVYVTFRRSLDPSLTWYRRFWSNGQRVADTNAPNIANHLLVKSAVKTGTVQSKMLTGTIPPQVNFSAGDIIGAAGKVVQVPIIANIVGSYPLRALMLNLTVTPLDGSPLLTTPVSFSQTASVLGAPYITSSVDNGNYAAVWLNTTNAGLTSRVTIGTLNVTIPAGAPTNAAYAVHFDHASGSPNGLASFPKATLTGLVTTSARTNSSYGDGIPDSWRLRWFGTVNNILSVSNACPSGDGVDNWNKYVAGVDPNVANDFPSLNPKSAVPSGYTAAIHWPTVSGKQYRILRSGSLFPGTWSILTTNTGTGTDMEYDDTYTNKTKFYRVQILQ